MNGFADSCLTAHMQKAMMRGVRRNIVHSNDTDVVVYLLLENYWELFLVLNFTKLF